MRTRTFVKALSAMFILGGAVSAKADFVNGGFELPNGGAQPSSWTSLGDASIGTSFTKTPIQGSQFGYASTSLNPGALSENSSTVALTGVALTASLGLPAIGTAGGLKTGTTSGSAFTQTLALNAGQTVSFRSDFATYNGANGDYAFYSLKLGAANAVATSFVDTTSGALATITNGDFGGQPLITRDTGWGSYSFTVGASGSYTVGFGVAHDDAAAPSAYSAVTVDAVAVAPLPSVAYGGFALLGGLGVMQIARRRKAVVA